MNQTLLRMRRKSEEVSFWIKVFGQSKCSASSKTLSNKKSFVPNIDFFSLFLSIVKKRSHLILFLSSPVDHRLKCQLTFLLFLTKPQLLTGCGRNDPQTGTPTTRFHFISFAFVSSAPEKQLYLTTNA